MKTPRKIQHTLMSSDSVLGTLGSNPAFSKGRQLVSFRFENRLHISMVSCRNGPTRHAYAWLIGPFWQDTLDMYVCMYVCMYACMYVSIYVCMCARMSSAAWHMSLGLCFWWAIEFKFLAWSSIAQSVVSGHSFCWRFGSRDSASNPAFGSGRQLVSMSNRKSLACAWASKLTTIMYLCCAVLYCVALRYVTLCYVMLTFFTFILDCSVGIQSVPEHRN